MKLDAYLSTFRIATLVCALGICSALAEDVGDTSLSDKVIQKIDGELMKTYGKDLTLTQNITQVLGITKPGETLSVRQMEADSDNEPTRKHYFNRPNDGSGDMIFFLQDNAANVVRGYRTDSGYHFLTGFVSAGTLSPISNEEGASGLKAEIVWWNRAVLGVIFHDKGKAAESKGAFAAALANFDQALEIDPGDTDNTLQEIAWLLATCPDATFRDGPKAVEAATKACKLSAWKKSSEVSILAAACAEAGRFDEAVKWENQYLQFPKLSESDVATGKKRLELYTAHQAYHTDK
jgi:tetratricopeptide (TPR) repeat protein